MKKLRYLWRLLRARNYATWSALAYDCEFEATNQMWLGIQRKLEREETQAEAYGAHLLAQAKQLLTPTK